MDENDDIEQDELDEPEGAVSAPRRRTQRPQTMRSWVLTSTVVVAVVVLVLAVWQPGRGDNSAAPKASPTASPTNGVVIPPASMCTTLPRSAAALAALAATPAATPGARTAGTASPAPATFPPQGVPADAQTTQSVILTIQVAIACHNAGDFARMFTLYTDDYVHRLLTEAAAQTQLPPEAVAILLGTPQPLPSAHWRGIQAIGEVDQLPDGRVTVLVVTVDPTRRVPTEPSLMVLVSKNGLWQIDNIFDLGGATPTP